MFFSGRHRRTLTMTRAALVLGLVAAAAGSCFLMPSAPGAHAAPRRAQAEQLRQERVESRHLEQVGQVGGTVWCCQCSKI